MASTDKNRYPVRCASCDALLSAGADACPVCGKPVRVPSAPSPEWRLCVWCGSAAPTEASRCPVCGVTLRRPDERAALLREG